MKAKIWIVMAMLIFALPSFSQSRYRIRDRRLSLEKQLRSDLESAILKAGPLYILGNLSLLNAGYNSNINNYSQEEESDYTLTASPNITMIAPFGRNFYLYLKGSYSYLFYLDNSGLDRSYYTLGADFISLFNYFTLSAGGSIQRESDFFESEIDQRLFVENRSGSIASEIKLSSNFSINLRFAQNETSYPDDDGLDDTLGRDSSAFTASVSTKPLPNTSFTLGYTRSDDEFESNPLYDSNRRSYTLTINWERQSKYFLDMSLSYTDFEPENAPGKGYKGYFPDILLTFPVFYRMNISLSSQRDIYYSRNTDNYYYISTRNGIEAEYALSKRFSLIASYFFGKNSYEYPRTTEDGEIIPEDDIYSYGGGFRILLFDILNIRLTVANEKKESNIPSNNYDTLRVYITTSYKF